MQHLQRAFDNQNQIYKYVVVFLIALFVGQTIGAIPLVIAMVIGRSNNGGEFVQPENMMDLTAYGINSNLGLLLVVLPFLFTLFIAILLIKSFHQRTVMDVVNGGNKFRWGNFWWGVLVWGLILFVTLVIALYTDPDNFELRFNPGTFIPLLIISVVFIPFQAGTEEFLFRGYLMQGIAARTRQPWLAILVPSLFFALMHGVNPEVGEYGFWTTMPIYLLFGCVFAVMSILDNGIEMAIGVHAINNVFGSVLVTNKSAAIQTEALFLQKEVNVKGEFWVLLASALVFFMVMAFLQKWDIRLLVKKVKAPETIEVAQTKEIG
jgi:membrane protease YdiL (CAAX protease family)